MATVHIGLAGHTATVSFGYNADVIELVKALPDWARAWCVPGRYWLVAAELAEGLADALEAGGHRVLVVGRARNTDHPLNPPSTGDWAGLLLEAVGTERVDLVCRLLAKALHPDAGGSTELMQALNAAKDRLAVSR